MIIVVSSFKGGVAKTTTCLHLATYLSQRKGTNRVVLADGDLNHSALSWYDRAGERVNFVVCDGDNIPEDYTHLVIDTPARPKDEELLALAESSDLLIIPTMTTPFSIEATVGTLAQLSSLPKDRYRILLTAVPPKPSRQGEKAYNAIKNADLPLFKGWIQRRTIYQDAELEGVPVCAMKGATAIAAWKDYEAIGKEIMRGQK